MKLYGVILLLIILVFTLKSQDFKEVKTARDVIDNYILASGGEDVLKSVESISMKGKMGNDEEPGEIELYFSNKYIYMDINSKMFSMKQAIDLGKQKGWMKFGTMIRDLKEEDINKSRKNSEGSLWKNYLDEKTSGITYELQQNETVNGNDSYVIDLLRDSVVFNTSYFDAKTFNKVREQKGSMTNDFSDFRKVGSTGIVMPYRVTSPSGDVSITEIKFNSKFNKKLLKKPEEEKKDSQEEEK